MASTLKIIIASFWFGFGFIACSADKPEPKSEDGPEPIAQVQTIKLEKSQISETLSAYGTVLPEQNSLQTISVPYNSRVEKILVNEGQAFQQGAVLLMLKPADDTALQLAQAKQELKAAMQEQKLVQERLNLQLATQMDLVTAQLRTDQAKAMMANLAGRGVNKNQQVKAGQPGVVHLLHVQQNQIVPAGSPLLQWSGQSQWLVRLGVEPGDFQRLQLNQSALLTPVSKAVAQPINGKIVSISQQIDPATRLLNVFVKPETNQHLLLNEFVQAQVLVSSANTLVAPRQAVLPDGEAYSLFTIEQGHAVKHRVKLGLENDAQVEVIADDLKVQDELVVLGNYELADGMAVVVQKP